MAKAYTKAQSAFKPNVKVSNVKPRKPIAKKSEKRTKEERVYLTLRKVFLENKMICEVKGCNCRSTEVHHKKGRSGELYLDVSKWLAVCHEHHVKITNNDEWAKENGYSENRL